MTVATLRAEMSNLEFLEWSIWYAREKQREQLHESRGR